MSRHNMLTQYDRWTRNHVRHRNRQRRFDRIFKVDTPDDDNNDDLGDDEIAAALHYLMHTSHGASVLRRAFPNGAASTADIEHLAQLIARQWRADARASDDADHDSFQPWADVIGKANTYKGEAFTMNRSERLHAVVKKAGGVHGLAKRIVRDGTSGDISEHELTALVVAEAKREHPDMSDVPGCARFMVSIACRSVAPIGPASQNALLNAAAIDGGRAARAAYRVLEKLADEYRRRSPNLSSAQAFARAFRDHPELAEMAHRRPRPTTSYPWPVR